MVIQQFNRLIRNKWIWGVFAIAISVFFAFDFLFTGGGQEGRSAGSAGTLGGSDFSASEFRTLAEDVRGVGRRRDHSMPEAEVNRQAWESAAALAVAKELHLTATDAEVREAIASDPGFRGEGGAFNMRQYEYLLRENGLTPEMYEAFLKRRITLSKINRAVLGSAAWVAPSDLDRAIDDVTDKFTVRIATFSDKNAAKVNLSDADLENYYKENTNSIALPDCATVRYIALKADDPARLAATTVTEDELKDHYDATSARFETQTTNGVVTKPFAEVKDLIEKELKLIGALEALRTNLLFRVYPPEGTADAKADRLAQIAATEKATVKVSPLFAMEPGRYVNGFMSRTTAFAPDVADFTSAVAELDPDSPDLRYGVVSGTNTVYLIERASFVKAHVPTFAEAKDAIRPAALAAARAKAFKESVEKVRALAAAGLAAGKAFDAKLLTGANVSTSITFTVSSLSPTAFPDARYAAGAAMKLDKGQISEFVPTATAAHGILVYMENREAGDAASAQMVRAQLRDELSSAASAELPSAWASWNLSRIGCVPDSRTSFASRDYDEDSVQED